VRGLADKFSKEKRSEIMSKIRAKDTEIELLVRKWLFSRGFRFRKNDRRYPGTPDIVLPKYKTAIFIHGCFWHFHQDCKHGKIPGTRPEFWREKFRRNTERDRMKVEAL
jgi:DNA mismatch endonuclease, patch repair protein